jgi:serine/threonine-protein kinase
MGAVYAGTHTGIGKRVALKFLDVSATHGDGAIDRFQREARAASAIESAHIVQIFDSGTTDDGRPYLVMELLEGEDLRTHLDREGPLPAEDVIAIAQQILRGLGRAHSANIIHRDLKPDNVFLCRRENEPLVVKIVDFGISKIARTGPAADTLTHQGTVLGTASYMSPEQAQSVPDIDGRADLFSVGAIVFEALAGRAPHEGPTYESVLIKICTEDAPHLTSLNEDVPPKVAATVARALARDRDQRFDTAEDFSAALGDALCSEHELARPARPRWLWLALAGGALTADTAYGTP